MASVNGLSFIVITVLKNKTFAGQKAGRADIARIYEVAIRNSDSCTYIDM